LGEGYTPEEVSNHILATAYENGELDSLEDQFELVLPLALIQWKSGRLQSEVKEFALELLTDEYINEVEGGLWKESEKFKERLAEVYKLRDIIQTDAPKPTRIKKVFHSNTKLKPGDLFTIKLTSGFYVLLEVIEIEIDGPSRCPSCVLFDYKSLEKPSAAVSDNLNVLKFKTPHPRINPSDVFYHTEEYGSITFLSTSQRFSEPTKRIEILAENGILKEYHIGTTRLCLWKDIDKVLEEWLAK
jgi:hypothetical protein